MKSNGDFESISEVRDDISKRLKCWGPPDDPDHIYIYLDYILTIHEANYIANILHQLQSMCDVQIDLDHRDGEFEMIKISKRE